MNSKLKRYRAKQNDVEQWATIRVTTIEDTGVIFLL